MHSMITSVGHAVVTRRADDAGDGGLLTLAVNQRARTDRLCRAAARVAL
jgi:K+ transporter